MKQVNKHIDKHGVGHVTLRPEDDQDMWHLYNLIQQGDLVRGPAVRRVQSVSATGSTDSQRVRLNLTLQVSSVLFSAGDGEGAAASNDPSSSSTATSTASLHISGRVTSENPHVRMGAHHTLDVETNRDIRIEKDPVSGSQHVWDSVSLGVVEQSIVPGRGAEVAAVVCGEGQAVFCLLSEHMTVIANRLKVNVPRKASGSQHDAGLNKFYSAVYDGITRHVPYQTPELKAIVVASPGWVRDAVVDYVQAEATKRGNKALATALRTKLVKVHVNSPHVHSLMEVLKNPQIAAQLNETKFAREGMALDKFFKMLGSDELRAWYGPDHVSFAVDRAAVGTLLISDELFRASDPGLRKKYVAMVEAVQQKGGEAVIFSSMHESGQRIAQPTHRNRRDSDISSRRRGRRSRGGSVQW
ncbi:eRF1 domain 1-domain-containing protein [Pterulicium gracile]|uniref:ERF1 domain 1-domain-containing protein n=1 Tax=Pterulicium gracile TaxID=1884261 RepID=A0A5C3R4L0_9AGAR|nr:eRF1 domain 1-domain-containing protein [Pterula gracilis]